MKFSPSLSLTLLTFFILGASMAMGDDVLHHSLSLRQALKVEGIRAHQLAFQQIANDNNNNRMAGSPGYAGSVEYVQKRLRDVGYAVELQNFPIHISGDNTNPELKMVSPTERDFLLNQDFLSMNSVGQAEVSAWIEAVDLKIPSPAPNNSTSGCEPSDFANFTTGNIALIQRGHCTFRKKIENAIDAQASGVIIFNEGNEGRHEAIISRLRPSLPNIPVLGASFATGEVLSNGRQNGPTGIRAVVKVDVSLQQHMVNNVIAETALGNDNRVVVVGAHLDSVREGPGLNDNGSGSATILELAIQYAQLNLSPLNKLRFIWFAAEEFGLLGSAYYVSSLSQEQRSNIMAMLNFDMLGSSNYARFVYDGDNSQADAPTSIKGSSGSAFIENVFLEYFALKDLISHPTSFDGRSDYGPFIEAGIPAGGLFSGAEGIKTPQMAEIYGGTAKAPFDPCYHKSCDDFVHTGGDSQFDLALKSLDELSSGAAHAMVVLADTPNDIRTPQRSLEPASSIEFDYRGNYLLR